MKTRTETGKDGTALEREVARIYTLLGADVETRTLIRGYEVDVLAIFRMGPIRVRVLAECKEYSLTARVSDGDMRSFVVKLLAAREMGVGDKGIFITTGDFSKTARATAARHGIQCVTLRDLRNQLVDFTPYISSVLRDFEASPLYSRYIAQRASEIEDYTSILSDAEAKRYIHAPLGQYVSDLFLAGERRLALLGNFGTGKSSFCEQYCYDLLREHQRDTSKRLPVRIHLRDFRSGLDIHQLIVGVLHRNFGVSIDERLCIELQRMGRFVFLLDGLDEMATKVDRAVLNENLREVSRLATDGDNKYLVTCRTHFFQERVVDQFLEDYRVLYLLDWDRDDLRRYLERRFPDGSQGLFERLIGSPRLEELSRTPQFVDMLLSGISDGAATTADLEQLTSLGLYEKYVNKWVEHESRRRGAVMASDKRREFVEYLASKLFEEDTPGIHFSQLYEVARAFSGYGDATRLDYFDTDVRNCTFITRNSAGIYGFRHRSFMEFGCASAVRREIRSGQPGLLRVKALTEEMLRFLGEMTFEASDLEALHSWSCLGTGAQRILAMNASRVLLSLREELRGDAAERFRVVDDPWTRIADAVAANNPQLFDETVNHSYQWLLRYVHRYIDLYASAGDELSAEEILQEILIRLWSSMGSASLPPAATPRASILLTVRRHIVDRSRLMQRRRELPFEIVEQGRFPVEAIASPSQEIQLQLREAVRAAVGTLSEREMALFRGRFLAGKTIDELAAEFSLSPATVRTRIYTMRRKVLNKIGK
jgi:RNA polymerase sigma factor (sigma-70 family)